MRNNPEEKDNASLLSPARLGDAAVLRSRRQSGGINGGGGLWRATGSTFYDAINNAPNEWTAKPASRPLPSVMAPSMVLPVETPEMTPGRWMTASCIYRGLGHCIWWG